VVVGDLVLAAEAVTPARRGRHDGTGQVRALSAFALSDGKPRWRNEQVHPVRRVEEKGQFLQTRAEFKPLSAADGLLLLHVSSYQFRGGGSVAVLDLGNGRELWRREFQPKQLYTQGSQRAILRGGEVIILDGLGAFRFDARTAKPLGEPIKPSGIRRMARANGACTASRATVDWLFCNAYLCVGPELRAQTFFGARGQCGEGVVPAHGLLFVPPASCDCGDYTRGYQALAPSLPGRPIADEERLVRGAPAPGQEQLGPAWPVFLGDPCRQSRAQEALPEKLSERWRVQAAAARSDHLDTDRRYSERYLGALSAPVVGDGLVVVAAPETHQVLAFDAPQGSRRWSFTAGGKVDSPPTLARGLAVFGCDDGAVYALRLADGELVWRFTAAPTDGLAMHHGHLASAFPVPGSVLMSGDAVAAVAGHHTDLGGLHCWVLELATGRARAHRVIGAEQPAVVTGAVPVADAGGRGFWMGCQLHLSWALEDLPLDDGQPLVWLDRNGTRMRYRTDTARGGSTHGWKQAMRSGWAAAHRVACDGATAYALIDPTEGQRHPVRAAETAVLSAGSGTWRDKRVHWSASVTDLEGKTSYGALIKAGERLYLGGGARDGSAGFVQVVDARHGKLVASFDLPARVTECGLAAAGGRLYVCCEDGTLLCFAAE
jgi:outer membrane protein assembly factor BamB